MPENPIESATIKACKPLREIGYRLRQWGQRKTESGQHATRLLVLAVVMLAAGCVSLEEMVPPVNEKIAAIGSRLGVSSQGLIHGRQVYLTRCINCHSVEPVDRYSQEQWQMIVPEMAAESKLNDRQTADLLAYLLSAQMAMSWAD